MHEWLPIDHSFHDQIQLLDVAQITRHSNGKEQREYDCRPHRSPKPPVRQRQRHQIIEYAELPPLNALRLENNVQNSEAVELRKIDDGRLGDLPVLPVPELQEENDAACGDSCCKSGKNSFVGYTSQPVVVVE